MSADLDGVVGTAPIPEPICTDDSFMASGGSINGETCDLTTTTVVEQPTTTVTPGTLPETGTATADAAIMAVGLLVAGVAACLIPTINRGARR